MDLTKIFLQLGFSSNKAKVYLAVLSLGTASATDIAKKSGIVRTTVYQILNQLISENLIEETTQGATKKFIAMHPAKLIELNDDNKKRIENSMPDLLNLFSCTEFKPKMRFYQGDAGIKKVYEDALSSSDGVVYTFSPIKNILGRFGEIYVRHIIEKRVKNKIKRLCLRQAGDDFDSKKTWEFYTTEPSVLREVHFLPDNIKFDTLVQIYDNKIGIISSQKENYGFIIESKELYCLMKQIFEWLWSITQ